MIYTTLISTSDLVARLGEGNWLLVDCRFDLANTSWGREQYSESHIRGALYAHLDEDLSGPIIKGRTGRHPLPSPVDLATKLSAWGVGNDTQVIAYDQGGGMLAARLWWLLRWLGHDKVAVLDGGWQRWQQEGREVNCDIPSPKAGAFVAQLRDELQAQVDDVIACQQDDSRCLLDARGADRFRGENETIDPVAGHIPGAVSAPFMNNLGSDGCFLDKPALRARYLKLMGDSDPGDAIIYCGSGVTAAHDVLAMLHVGLDEPRLYVGSWSHWVTDPSRAVVIGDG